MLVLSLVLLACKKEKEIECSDSLGWEEGTESFVEKTNEWGLEGIQAVGTP